MSCLLQDGKEEAAVCLEGDPIDVKMAVAELPDEGKEEVPDLTPEEYKDMPADQKSAFHRPAAYVPMMDAGGSAFPCSLLEDNGAFYQDAHKQTIPILKATIACLFASVCVCMCVYVCVVCGCVC